MARRWQTVTVELVQGRGDVLDPAPGRVMLLPPRTTFDQLGEAIDLAFARWDLSHLRQFVLPDGAVVCDEESALDEQATPVGAIRHTVPLGESVRKHVTEGDVFSYVFDFGDGWTHLCTVDGHADPTDVYGPDPSRPVPISGWGTIPDQYGRRWRDDTGSETSEPPPPPQIEESIRPWGGMPRPAPPVDLRPVRVACVAGDVDALLDAVVGVDLDPALQQLGALALPVYRAAAGTQADRLSALLVSLHARLRQRGWDGDDLLAEGILAALQGRDTEPPLRPLPVDIDEVLIQTSSVGEEFEGGYLNTRTGEVVSSMSTDASYVGDDAVVDVDADDAWQYVPPPDSHSGWKDMESFADRVTDPGLRERLLRAIEGRGAFRRFKDVLHQDADESTRARWYLESEDRNWGRVRESLAVLGIRPE